jgi:GNAT superfamily N-acetyltransferase
MRAIVFMPPASMSACWRGSRNANGVEGELSALCVREVTRRRGVGQYLVEEVLKDNPEIGSWRIADAGGRPRRDGGVYAGAGL